MRMWRRLTKSVATISTPAAVTPSLRILTAIICEAPAKTVADINSNSPALSPALRPTIA